MQDAKKYLLLLLKVAFPLAIIVWLVSTIDRQQLAQLQQRPKDWGRLTAAFVICLTAVCITFVRWFLLVRALHMRFTVRDAFRLGFLGYLLNFVSIGSIGGDLFKAIFIARDQPGRRTEAIATVMVDRVIGFYALLLVVSLAILTTAPPSTPVMNTLCKSALAVTAIATLGIGVAMLPGFTNGPLAEMLGSIPKIGRILAQLISAVRMYRGRPFVMAEILGLAMCVHCLLCISLYLVSTSLAPTAPSLGEHFIVIPLSMVAGGLPFTPAGLGTFEFAMDALFKQVSQSGNAPGILIALAYRLITIAVAGVGVVYYWSARREIDDVMRKAAAESEEASSQ
jgi:uncharacterized protein (TIRG00374 family)